MEDKAEITKEHLDNHVHSRLRTRVRLYVGLSIIILLVIAYRLFIYGGNIIYPIIAFGIGLGIGLLFSRMFHISWDNEAEKVVSGLDRLGVAFLIIYILIEVASHNLIRHWFSGPEVLTVILSLAGGAMLGRGWGMGRKMIEVLRENI